MSSHCTKCTAYQQCNDCTMRMLSGGGNTAGHGGHAGGYEAGYDGYDAAYGGHDAAAYGGHDAGYSGSYAAAPAPASSSKRSKRSRCACGSSRCTGKCGFGHAQHNSSSSDEGRRGIRMTNLPANQPTTSHMPSVAHVPTHTTADAHSSGYEASSNTSYHTSSSDHKTTSSDAIYSRPGTPADRDAAWQAQQARHAHQAAEDHHETPGQPYAPHHSTYTRSVKSGHSSSGPGNTSSDYKMSYTTSGGGAYDNSQYNKARESAESFDYQYKNYQDPDPKGEPRKEYSARQREQLDKTKASTHPEIAALANQLEPLGLRAGGGRDGEFYDLPEMEDYNQVHPIADAAGPIANAAKAAKAAYPVRGKAHGPLAQLEVAKLSKEAAEANIRAARVRTDQLDKYPHAISSQKSHDTHHTAALDHTVAAQQHWEEVGYREHVARTQTVNAMAATAAVGQQAYGDSESYYDRDASGGTPLGQTSSSGGDPSSTTTASSDKTHKSSSGKSHKSKSSSSREPAAPAPAPAPAAQPAARDKLKHRVTCTKKGCTALTKNLSKRCDDHPHSK